MWKRAVVAIVLLILPAAAIAQGERRIALLIGNQSYGTEIGRLTNPHNDVALLEKSLKGLGFEVTTVRDAGLGGLHQAVNAYARRLQAAGPNAVAFFYYSGHGAADGSVNYLIPIDAKTSDTGELWDQSLRLTEITRKLKSEAGNATHFVVFDACRNTLKLTRAGTRSLVQSKGFVPVAQESGMLIAYATAEGELALDVGVGAGPYAKALAEEMVKPGVEAVTMFRTVQIRVKQQIGQDPWLTFPSLPPVYLAGTARIPEPGSSTPSKSAATAGTATYEQQAELAIWTSVKDSKDPIALQLYLDRYPNGAFADLAKLMIAQARREADARQADTAKRAAEAQRIEAEQKARAAETAKQQDQLRQALEEVRQAREASKAAERDRLAAEKAAQEAREALKAVQPAKAAPSPTQSPTSSGQKAAWVKLCEKATATQKTKEGKEEKKDLNICLTHHERLDGNSGMVLVSAAVRQVEGQDKEAFMVMVPLGMMIQPGMRGTLYSKDLWEKAEKNEKVDESKLKTLNLAYTLCHPAGCTAETEATPELLNDLKKGGGLMVFAINAAGAPAAFPVPLAGFEASYFGPPVDAKAYSEARNKLMKEIADRQRK